MKNILDSTARTSINSNNSFIMKNMSLEIDQHYHHFINNNE